MKILVLTTDYPSDNGKVAHRFVHVRNVVYQQNGIDVTVLNFAAEDDYVFEDIPVITLDTYQKSERQYDLLISHQPNLRKHLPFLLKYGDYFPKYLFFFHGHEVLNVNKVYPKPYSYMRGGKIKRLIQAVYDAVKLPILRGYFTQVARKSRYVFVSHSLKEQFFKYVRVERNRIEKQCYVINNSVGEIFQEKRYTPEDRFTYDFITIRSNMDSSTYCLDLVVEAAKALPDRKFLVIGKGKFFEHFEKPYNITWIATTLPHVELLSYINQSRYALMLTRNDTQGVMSCELATFGIPLLTSDIPVCHEIFEPYGNVVLLKNNDVANTLRQALHDGVQVPGKRLYLIKDTVAKEVELLTAD